MKLLTIIIANYNNGHLLKECIASICQAESYGEECEILVVDDHSTDNSLDVIAEIAKIHAVQVCCHEQNGGVEAAFNTGINLARGEYIHLFGADDHYLPGALDTLIQTMKLNRQIALFSSDYVSFAPSTPYKNFIQRLLPLRTFHFLHPNQVFYIFRHTDFWIPGHTAIIKRDIYLTHAPQDKKLRSAADWYINHCIALEQGVGYIPQALIARREDCHSYSSSISLTERHAIWLHLLSLLEQKRSLKLARSGICRMLGLKAIYYDLLKRPKYWKYLFPMMRKEIEKQAFALLRIDRSRFWLSNAGIIL